MISRPSQLHTLSMAAGEKRRGEKGKGKKERKKGGAPNLNYYTSVRRKRENKRISFFGGFGLSLRMRAKKGEKKKKRKEEGPRGIHAP